MSPTPWSKLVKKPKEHVALISKLQILARSGEYCVGVSAHSRVNLELACSVGVDGPPNGIKRAKGGNLPHLRPFLHRRFALFGMRLKAYRILLCSHDTL